MESMENMEKSGNGHKTVNREKPPAGGPGRRGVFAGGRVRAAALGRAITVILAAICVWGALSAQSCGFTPIQGTVAGQVDLVDLYGTKVRLVSASELVDMDIAFKASLAANAANAERYLQYEKAEWHAAETLYGTARAAHNPALAAADRAWAIYAEARAAAETAGKAQAAAQAAATKAAAEQAAALQATAAQAAAKKAATEQAAALQAAKAKAAAAAAQAAAAYEAAVTNAKPRTAVDSALAVAYPVAWKAYAKVRAVANAARAAADKARRIAEKAQAAADGAPLAVDRVKDGVDKALAAAYPKVWWAAYAKAWMPCSDAAVAAAENAVEKARPGAKKIMRSLESAQVAAKEAYAIAGKAQAALARARIATEQACDRALAAYAGLWRRVAVDAARNRNNRHAAGAAENKVRAALENVLMATKGKAWAGADQPLAAAHPKAWLAYAEAWAVAANDTAAAVAKKAAAQTAVNQAQAMPPARFAWDRALMAAYPKAWWTAYAKAWAVHGAAAAKAAAEQAAEQEADKAQTPAGKGTAATAASRAAWAAVNKAHSAYLNARALVRPAEVAAAQARAKAQLAWRKAIVAYGKIWDKLAANARRRLRQPLALPAAEQKGPATTRATQAAAKRQAAREKKLKAAAEKAQVVATKRLAVAQKALEVKNKALAAAQKVQVAANKALAAAYPTQWTACTRAAVLDGIVAKALFSPYAATQPFAKRSAETKVLAAPYPRAWAEYVKAFGSAAARELARESQHYEFSDENLPNKFHHDIASTEAKFLAPLAALRKAMAEFHLEGEAAWKHPRLFYVMMSALGKRAPRLSQWGQLWMMIVENARMAKINSLGIFRFKHVFEGRYYLVSGNFNWMVPVEVKGGAATWTILSPHNTLAKQMHKMLNSRQRRWFKVRGMPI